ncbi:MAG: shikimate dehydrogenase [Acidobacteriota bacterium]
MPALCLTLAEEFLPDLERKLACYASRVSMIEVRLDWLRQPALPRLPEVRPAELLATVRPPRQGGRWAGTEAERLELLRKAAAEGYQWLDIEDDVGPFPVPPGTKVVHSFHDFAGMPDLDSVRLRLEAHPADCYKIAVQVDTTRQLVELLRWRERLGDAPFLVLGMGEMGRPSRLLGGFLGNPWTYVAEDGERPAAPGQFTLREAVEIYRLDAWTSVPELYGVLGNPVAHSRSPHLHNALFRHYGLEKLYVPLAVDDLQAWFDYVGSTRLPFRGFSVTIPHKLEVGRFAVEHETAATSVNTLSWNGSGWTAANTDIEGFLRPLQVRCPAPSGKTAVVLGNGGVAESVIPALQSLGMEVQVVGRDPIRVAAVAARHGCAWSTFQDFAGEAYLCVNTTPVGQHPRVEESPLGRSQMRFQLVYDLVYNPPRTRLLAMAEELGIPVISGVEMFIEQAAGQFRRWTGIEPDRRIMWRAVQETTT